MSKPETRYYTAIHKLLPRSIHREKMHNMYRGGTADVWYSGNLDDLWVEYKWLAKLPKKAPVRLDKELSPLQQRWLQGRHDEGRNVCVIFGTPEGSWICTGASWKEPIYPEEVRNLNISKAEVAEYITNRTLINDEMANPRYPSEQSDISIVADNDDDSLLD